MSFKVVKTKFVPEIDADFKPLSLIFKDFEDEVNSNCDKEELIISLLRGDNTVTKYSLSIFASKTHDDENFSIAERVIKTLLWAKGGYKLYVYPERVGNYIKTIYSKDGERSFDAEFMGTIYENEFEVVPCKNICDMPPENETARKLGGHLDGRRVGFDAGASDRKVAAVMNGEAVYDEEVVWDPRPQTNPDYHYNEIMTAVQTAADKMGGKVDAIGVSSAGVYINNKVMSASLFRGISPELFEKRIKNIFFDIKKAWNNVPLEVVNDGDVTALAGAMSLNDTAIIGVAMGSSEAAGYVTPEGTITNWLNELAFVPVDGRENAPIDEWSLDRGCGVQYFSQQAVARLIPLAGIEVEEGLGFPEQLKVVQKLMENNDQRARKIYDAIGIYLGYALAWYAKFYDFRHALILGRVTSGKGGPVILNKAKEVLADEFPHLAEKISVNLPDEKNRRVGQAIAAASLPEIS